MTYSNVKSGLRKLFIAEILAIAADFSFTFNGSSSKIFSILPWLLSFAAFAISLYGLKRCAADEKGYRLAFFFMVAAMIIRIGIAIQEPLFVDTAVVEIAKEALAILNFLVIYVVTETTAVLFRSCSKESEAAYADKVKRLCAAAFIFSELLSIGADLIVNDLTVILTVAAAVAALVIQFIATVTYIVFLKRSSDAL